MKYRNRRISLRIPQELFEVLSAAGDISVMTRALLLLGLQAADIPLQCAMRETSSLLSQSLDERVAVKLIALMHGHIQPQVPPSAPSTPSAPSAPSAPSTPNTPSTPSTPKPDLPPENPSVLGAGFEF